MSQAFAYNLGHEAFAAWGEDGSFTLSSIADCQAVTLTRAGQLLLLDALCKAYAFPSPIASIVNQVPVGDGPEAPPEGP